MMIIHNFKPLAVSCLLLALLALSCTELEEELTPENTPEATKSYGSISITSDPSGASIWLDGDSSGAVTDTTLGDILIGKHSIRLTQLGWADIYNTVTVHLDQTTQIEKQFSEVYGSLQISSTPTGADIYIDGVASGKKTNCTLERLQVGSHTVDLVLQGYGDIEYHDTVDIVEGETETISATMHCGGIQVNSVPTGADIYIDETSTGERTNYLLERVQSGQHTVKLVKNGYVDWQKTFSIATSKTDTCNAELVRQTGNIQVNSTPTGAQIWLDGENTGHETNYLIKNLPTGTYTVKLTKSGYGDWQQDVAVNNDQTTTINADLNQNPGKIQVNSTPQGAEIWIADSSTGHFTNYLLDNLPAGNYTVRLIKGYYYDWVTTVTVEPEQTTTVNADLEYIGGELKWKFQTGYQISSSPAVNKEGTVYVGSNDNYLYAIDPNGQLVWSYLTGDVVSDPTIGSDGSIFFGSWDECIYALDTYGELKWSFNMSDIVSSPLAIESDNTIYAGRRLRAISESGVLIWTFVPDGLCHQVLECGPSIASDGTVYFTPQNSKLYALYPDGSLKWECEPYSGNERPNTSPAIASDGTIYIGSYYNYLYAINPDGSIKWEYKTDGPISSSPVIDYDGSIYFGCGDKYLYALTPDGALKWRYKTNGYIHSTPAIGYDGCIYVGSTDNFLYAINPDGSLKWKFETGDVIYSSPAIAMDGTIYVGSRDGYLYAIASSSVGGLANSPWPKFQHDNQNTGRYGGP